MHYIIVGSFKPPSFSILDSMYFGYFNTETSGQIPNGELRDGKGIASSLGKLILEDGVLEFTQYQEDGGEVRYALKRDRKAWIGQNAWVGTCRDSKGTEIHTRCIIDPVNLDFLT